MKTCLAFLATLLVSLAYVPQADARYCCVGYRHHAYYRAHPNYGRMMRLPPPPRWSLGGHMAVASTNTTYADSPTVLGGLGAHLRFRGYRFGLELAADFLGNSSMAEGTVERLSIPIKANLMLYLVPEGVFNLYLLGGGQIVPTRITLNYPDQILAQTFTQAGAQVGGGFEVNLGHRVSFVVDARFFGLMRLDENEPGMFYDVEGIQNPILPDKEVGMQFNMGGSIRW